MSELLPNSMMNLFRRGFRDPALKIFKSTDPDEIKVQHTIEERGGRFCNMYIRFDFIDFDVRYIFS